ITSARRPPTGPSLENDRSGVVHLGEPTGFSGERTAAEERTPVPVLLPTRSSGGRSSREGGGMRKSKWLAAAALVGALTVVAAACGNNNTPSGGGTSAGADPCASDQFGCVKYAAGAPIRIGTLLAISGDVATLGTDSLNGVKLAIDHLDGKFDATPGQLLGHDVEIQSEDDLCSKDGGQTGGTKLASDPTILSVIGTSCSSSALGVADKILGDKGIILISPSNTAAGLTAPDQHNPFYMRTAQNDAIQAKVVSDFVYTKLGFTKAATIHDESPYAAGLTGGFKTFFEQAGGTVTDE